MRFVIATRDYAGLGFAIRLQDEGHEVLLATNPSEQDLADPATRSAYDLVGRDLVPKADLADVMRTREQRRGWYWIWDQNHAVVENETLRAERFKVLGGGQHADRMEHSRQACLDFAADHDLQSPPSFPFTDPAEAVRFCSDNPNTAYVYKPDEGANFETFLPESEDALEANLELRIHLESLQAPGSFILQERKEGVETNVEVWFVQGEPVFAFMTLEAKRRFAMDMGELIGCAFDFAWVIPLGCRAVTQSVGKLYPAYEKLHYTGFADANFIAARDGIWFLEKCERFGYNAHPNLFWNLNLSTLGEALSGMIDGTFRPQFCGGFGASVTMSTKTNPTGGQVIQFPDTLWKDIFFWDAYRRGEHILTAGYESDGSILILTAYGYTIPTAWEALMRRAAQVKFPYRHYRPDGDRTDYPSSPSRRYEALKAMGYV